MILGFWACLISLLLIVFGSFLGVVEVNAFTTSIAIVDGAVIGFVIGSCD